jgi:hypothetical protein
MAGKEKRPAEPRPEQQIVMKGRRGPSAGPKPVPPLVTCERCGRKVRAASVDGTIGPHLRDARPGDPEFTPDVPVMVPCDRQATSI